MRKNAMTEFSITGHQMRDDHGRPINSAGNFTESLCRAVRDIADKPRGDLRQSLHHIMRRDKKMCSRPIRLWTARPNRRKRNKVWRIFVDIGRFKENGRFQLRKCKITGRRKGDGEFDRDSDDGGDDGGSDDGNENGSENGDDGGDVNVGEAELAGAALATTTTVKTMMMVPARTLRVVIEVVAMRRQTDQMVQTTEPELHTFSAMKATTMTTENNKYLRHQGSAAHSLNASPLLPHRAERRLSRDPDPARPSSTLVASGVWAVSALSSESDPILQKSRS
jgi:hypothetical protein